MSERHRALMGVESLDNRPGGPDPSATDYSIQGPVVPPPNYMETAPLIASHSKNTAPVAVTPLTPNERGEEMVDTAHRARQTSPVYALLGKMPRAVRKLFGYQDPWGFGD